MNGVSAQPRLLPTRGGLVVVAGELGLREITAKIPMTKMRVRSAADLVRAVEALELRRAERSTA
jgi:hypothetical protein